MVAAELALSSPGDRLVALLQFECARVASPTVFFVARPVLSRTRADHWSELSLDIWMEDVAHGIWFDHMGTGCRVWDERFNWHPEACGVDSHLVPNLVLAAALAAQVCFLA